MRIAIAGLGNVGAATLKLLRAHAGMLARRAGQGLDVVAVSARDPAKGRGCDLTGIEWVSDPRLLATRGDSDVVVELIGGAGGIAYEIAVAALNGGKHLVTANKAMIAAHGVELAALAEKKGVSLSFEASVCGAVPVLQLLRAGLAANKVSSVRGILNGTCNYILTRMQEGGVDFDAALAEAQRLGYAEADPANDIDGVDTANKLAILTAMAFGRAPDLAAMAVQGIRAITQKDLRDAAAKNGRIKLLGSAVRTENGIAQTVQPVFVPQDAALAGVGGVLNAVEIMSDFAGQIFIQGQGAGGDAAASAIVGDLVGVARDARGFAFGVAGDALAHG